MCSPVSKHKLQSPCESFSMESSVDLSSASYDLMCCGWRECTCVGNIQQSLTLSKVCPSLTKCGKLLRLFQFFTNIHCKVLLLSNPFLLKSVVKLINLFKCKKRAIISRVAVSVNEITVDTVSIFLVLCEKNWDVIPLDSGGYNMQILIECQDYFLV